MEISAKVTVVETKTSESYSQRDYEVKLFDVTVEGHSTKDVEEKIGRLQEAITHMGWKLK